MVLTLENAFSSKVECMITGIWLLMQTMGSQPTPYFQKYCIWVCTRQSVLGGWRSPTGFWQVSDHRVDSDNSKSFLHNLNIKNSSHKSFWRGFWQWMFMVGWGFWQTNLFYLNSWVNLGGGGLGFTLIGALQKNQIYVKEVDEQSQTRSW